jgi:hypothetical protein
MSAMRWLVVIALLVGCDADAWSPRAEHDRATARRATELAAHLETLPGIARASVALDAPYADPLAKPSPTPPPVASVVIELEPGADRATTETLVKAVVDGEVMVLAAAPLARPATAAGPWRGLLAVALAVIAGLAIWIVAIYRRAARPQ